VLIDEGAHVQAGEVLVRLDRTAYELEYQRARALVERARALLAEEEARGAGREEEIRQAEAAVQAAAAQRDHRKAELARLQTLVKAASVSAEAAREAEAQRLVAEASLLQALSNVKLLQKAPQRERVAAARAALAAAEAERDLARFRLDNTVLRAPASGTVLAKHVQVGETVRPDALVDGRALSICEIADLSQLQALLDIAERDLPKVFQGQPCELRLAAVPDVVYKGQVSRLLPTISPQTATAQARVRIEVPKDDRNLRPGMFAEVRLLAKE
jgi:multidrug resistance efflux pump